MEPKNLIRSLDGIFRLVPALILDVDKTLRRNKNNHAGFINKPDEQELMPGMVERVAEFKKLGYLVLLLSNQGGLAHGVKTQRQLDEEIADLYELIGRQINANPLELIDAGYFCPFMQSGRIEPLCHRSLFRKPFIGGLAYFELKFYQEARIMIDWNNSLMVGDQAEDSELAANAHIMFYSTDSFLETPVNEVVARVQSDVK